MKKICFIDFTKFSYSYEDKYSPNLRGAETTLINLSHNLSKLNYEVFVFNNCSKNFKDKNYNWTDISNIKNYNLVYDYAISNGDLNLLNNVKANKKFAISYSIQTIEKFLRKKQFLSFVKNKPKIILIGDYHKSKRPFLTRIFGYDFLDLSIDDIFNNSEILNDNLINDKKAIFTSRHDRNMDMLIKLWKKIYSYNNKINLYLTPSKNENLENNSNIFFRNMGSQKDLIEDIKSSRLMLIPGHKAELFCLAAEEARELCVPIITLGIGSLKERVDHGKTGFIAKNEKEFVSYTLDLFNDNTLWNYLRNNLIKLRGSKNWMKSCKNFIKVLEKV